MPRLQRVTTRVWLGLSAGAGLGLLARDIAGLPGPVVVLVWLTAALLACFGLGRS